MSLSKKYIATGVSAFFWTFTLASSPYAMDADDHTQSPVNGVSVYGTVDVDLTYQTHGTPANGDYPAGTETIVMKNSNKSVFSLGQNGTSASKIGFLGNEGLVGDWSAVFKAETGFSPLNGSLDDGLKALTENNGVALTKQATGGDNGRAGQLINAELYVGISSPTFGKLTFGRNNALTMDDGQQYDPQGAAPGFALIGILNTMEGMGDTEDYRPDGSIKYTISGIGPLHFGALYEPDSPAGVSSAVKEIAMGVDYGNFSSDLTYNKVRGAIAATALTAAQLAKTSYPNGISGTVSDNTSYSAVAKYTLEPLTVFAGWEHLYYANPTHPLAVGAVTIGNYVLAAVNNTAYTNNKVLTIWWTGFRYHYDSRLTINSGFYQYRQNSYDNDNGCTTAAISAACSGTENAASIRADYALTKKLSLYGGVMYSWILGGFANGALNNNTVSPALGLRYSF